MNLVCDDATGIYFWLDDNGEQELSPHFDYEEDAILWYGRIATHIFEEFGITKETK